MNRHALEPATGNSRPPSGANHILDFHLDASKILALADGGEKEAFSPLPLRNLVPHQEIPFNVYIKCKPKDHTQPEFTLCCPQGQVFQKDWHRKLAALKVPWVYFPRQEEESVLSYLHGNLKEVSPEGVGQDPEKAAQVLDAMLLWMQHCFTAERARTGSRMRMALDFIDLVFEFIKTGNAYLNLTTAIKKINCHDKFLFKHSLNVCIFGLAFFNYLGLQERDAKLFGVGALLHDLGMTQVPQEILRKPESLDEEEMKLVKRHPLLSYHMLKNLSYFPPDPMLMVQQHHENGDGSGYPLKLAGSAIHPWARILRVIDSYESVTSGRPWRPAKSPKETLWSMRHEWEQGRIYDRAILQAFIKFLGEVD
ncbi:MAG: HD-GYP domain-containing protein [Thermodesulfobacteriota bacterium]